MTSVLQTDQWAAFKTKYGWQSWQVNKILLLSRSIIAGKELWYAPEVGSLGPKEAGQLTDLIIERARGKNVFLFRLELAVPFSKAYTDYLQTKGFRKSFESVQPENRAVVDIRSDIQQILAAMHQKGRYNIRVAQRHGIVVEQSDDLENFYRLYQETATRDGFSPRSAKYLQDLLSMVPGAVLFLARKNRKFLAGAIVVFFENTASYLYGASSAEERRLMAPYLLHWTIIQEGKRRGCIAYDLGEIPPPDQPNHPLGSLGEFKLKFGAKPIQLMGSWDYVFQPFWYLIFRIVEKLRRGFRA